MKKSRLYKFILFVIAFFFIALISNSSKAASISISTSKSSVSPGESFSITVSVSGGAGKVNVSATNASLSKTSLDLMLQSSMTITCTAGSSGTISISASGVVADYSTEKDANISASPKSVKIVQKTSSNGGSTSNSSSSNNGGKTDTNTGSTTKSSVATLSNLGIRPNDFSGFSANKTSYSTEVPNNVESIEIYANKGQSGQTISGTGKKTLKEGTNTFSIVVTAEDGKTKKTYTVNVTRKAKDNNNTENETTEETTNETTSEDEVEDPTAQAFGLTKLSIAGVELQPQFQTDVYEYRIELKENLDKIDIEAIATEENANVEITGNENLQDGENVITILVKGDTEDKNVAYQIIVNKSVENQEETNTNTNKIKNIIIISTVAVLVLIVIIIIVVSKVKNKKNEAFIPYGGVFEDNDVNENDSFNNYDNNNDSNIEENNDFEEYEEEKPKKKRSKGKRFK